MPTVTQAIIINGKTYDLGRLIGKTFYATKDVKVWDAVPLKYKPYSKVIGTVKSGNPIGVMFSWNTDKDGSIYLMFERGKDINRPANTFGSYFVKVENNAFNISSLKEQGLLTIKEEIQKEESQSVSFQDKLLKNLKTIGLIVAIGFVGVQLLKAYRNK